MRSEPSLARSRTRGQRTATGPMPVIISRSGRCPWRTSRWRPSSVSLSAWLASKTATSASTACASSARAPLRRISVSGSAKVPGWQSWKTLALVTAYHSFGGEVEASSTPTIRRLTPSCRHQLSLIARHPEAITFPGLLIWRIGGDLFFSSIGHVGEALKASLDARLDVKRVLLDFSQVNFIDISASDELLSLIKELKNRGFTLAFARVRDAVRDDMRLAGIEAVVGPRNFYERITDGVRAGSSKDRLVPERSEGLIAVRNAASSALSFVQF